MRVTQSIIVPFNDSFPLLIALFIYLFSLKFDSLQTDSQPHIHRHKKNLFTFFQFHFISFFHFTHYPPSQCDSFDVSIPGYIFLQTSFHRTKGGERELHTNQDELCFIISFALCFYLSANKPWKLIAFPLLSQPRIQQIALSAYFLHTNSSNRAFV